MGVCGRLCVPRSIDSASIPQQPCDPSVMLLIVTPAGSRASARARQSRGGGKRRDGGGQMARGREGGRGKRAGERRVGIIGGEWEQKWRRRDGWDCGLCGIAVQGRPSWFLRPLVPLCPPMSLYVQPCPWTQSHSHSQITSVAHIPE